MNLIRRIFNRFQKSGYGYHGFWVIRGYRPDGSCAWLETIPNKVVNEALNHNLGVQFKAGTQYSTYYIGLFSSDSTPTATWTYANIGTDFTEFATYDESNRVTWTSGSVASQSISNTASPAVFTASTGVNTTIYGAFMCNFATKSDNSYASGLIWCATRFGTSRPFVATETISIVYTITASSVS